MSKISIKTDFADGEKLFAQQLNNNFLVIQAGINANEENLQQVIDQAVIELDRQLEEITANRGWDWNGGDRVTFFKGNTSQVNAQEIKNGQLLYNTDSGETALDDDGERIVTGSGNVVSISENEPTNPSTKIWIKPSKIVRYAASYVTNNMSGEDTDKAPSVKAVKDYVNTSGQPVGIPIAWESDISEIADTENSIHVNEVEKSCLLTFAINRTSATEGSFTIGTFDTTYAPNNLVIGNGITSEVGNVSACQLSIDSNGNININNKGHSSNTFRGQIKWYY